jgi:hypothetical protein
VFQTGGNNQHVSFHNLFFFYSCSSDSGNKHLNSAQYRSLAATYTRLTPFVEIDDSGEVGLDGI